MKKEELWLIYIEKNPKFIQEDAHITFTTNGLRKFFEQTWDLAHKQGIENGKALKAMNESTDKQSKTDSSDFGDIFGSLFGKKY